MDLKVAIDLDQELTKVKEEEARKLLAEDLSKGRLEWQAFQSYTQKLSQSTYLRFVSENKFKAGLYVEREEVNTEIQKFLNSDKKGLILVAESGLGKTNLFCQWEQSLLQRQQATLLFYGREYDGSEISDLICNQLQLKNPDFKNSFQGDFDELLELLGKLQEVKKGERQIIILIDAVNEYSDPEEFFERLVRFIQKLPYPWVKVMLSIRTFVWDNLKDRFLFETNTFYHSQDLSGKPISFLSLMQFTEKELELAYERYKQSYDLQSRYAELSEATKRLLRNPLLLRFVSEAYKGKVLPHQLFTSDIFHQYKKERINQQDHYFLDYLTEAMWRLGSDELSLDSLDPPQLTSQNNPLERESVVNPSHPILAEKLREYIFSDPVYETTSVPTCIVEGCPKRHRELSVEQIALLDQDVKGKCFDCGATLGAMTVDYRTTYDRLLSENIIQRFPTAKDTALRYTYDRMFEYCMGQFIYAHVLNDFLNQGGHSLRDISGRITHTYIFWGALRNVLVEYLRKEEATNLFWWNVIEIASELKEEVTLSEDMKLVQHDIELATRHILSSAFEDYYQEQPKRLLDIVSYLIASRTATLRTSVIALDCMQNVLIALPELNTTSKELDPLRFGLRSQYPEVRSEACRIVTSLYILNSEVVISLMEELHKELLGTMRIGSIVSLVSAQKRKHLLRVVDSHLQLILSILGVHFSEEKTRNRIVSMAILLLKNRLFILLKDVLKMFLPSKLASIYWEKGPYAMQLYRNVYLSQGWME